MQNFSFFDRPQITKDLKTTEFDILVIGGGITGAGIALDAASRGMKVALVEKNDFASGTSSKSTKLIHGGLRYLKQFDFWLVKEVGTERAIVHELAPHLVVPEKMILPLIEGGSYGTWLTSIGLKVYDILASVEGDDKRKMLNKKEALKKEPLLPNGILKGAGYYAEYRTDDARLTIEIIKTAIKYGAKTLNYVEANEFIYKKKRVVGAKVRDVLSGEDFDIKAKYVVNAAGPWVDELRTINKSNKGKRLYLTKGVHLVVPHEKLPVQQSVYFDVPDGRMMFAIPRGKVTYFGTTDTHYEKDKDDINISIVDATYLISAVNNMFPDIELTLDDVESSWAGLRPLIHEDGKSASELSRKDEIFYSDSKLISIAGGKLTGYRKMAERIVNMVARKLKKRFEEEFDDVSTQKIPLTEHLFKNYKEVKAYVKAVTKRIAPLGLSQVDAGYLVHNYGKQTDTILKNLENTTTNDIEIALIEAELAFCLQHEMVCTPLDFFLRRTGRLFFDIQSIEKAKEAVLTAFTTHLKWDAKTKKNYLNELEEAIAGSTRFE